jgi:hypothetical protein
MGFFFSLSNIFVWKQIIVLQLLQILESCLIYGFNSVWHELAWSSAFYFQKAGQGILGSTISPEAANPP